MRKCPRCDEALLPTPSGSVCSTGKCGGVHPKMNTAERRWCNAVAANVPEARSDGFTGLYMIDGIDGSWKKHRGVTTHRPSKKPAGSVVAFVGDSLFIFVRC